MAERPALMVRGPRPANALLAAEQIKDVRQNRATRGRINELDIQQRVQALDDASRSRAVEEARLFGRAFRGVGDQATYDRAVQSVAPFANVGQLPTRFDQGTVDRLVQTADILAPTDDNLLSEEAFNQQLQLRQAGRAQGTTVNVDTAGNRLPNPPPGTVYATNPDGSVQTQPVELPNGQQALQPIVVPIAGGPVAREEAEATAAAETQRQQQQMSAQIVSQSAAEIRRLIDEAVLPTTGAGGALLSRIGGTAARNVAAQLETIKANASFERLQQMRNASPTGGALGQVSNTEISLLSNAIGALEQSQSEEEFLRNLARVEERFSQIVNGRPDLTPDAISRMTIDQLPATTNGLTPEQRQALDRRLTELGF